MAFSKAVFIAHSVIFPIAVSNCSPAPQLIDRKNKEMKPFFCALLAFLFCVLGLWTGAIANDQTELQIDLSKIGHLSPKGRVQDKDYNPDLDVVDQIIEYRKKSIPYLIGEITNEKEIGFGIIDYWGIVDVGDIAFVILVDFFTDETWQMSTVEGYGFWDLIDGESGDIPAATQYRSYIQKHGRLSLQQKWQRLWVKRQNDIYWDIKNRCFRIKNR